VVEAYLRWLTTERRTAAGPDLARQRPAGRLERC